MKQLMKCQDFEELISDYLDGLLTGEDQTMFAEHMLACVDCRGLTDEVRYTIQYCREDKSVEIRPAFEAQILSLTKQTSLPLELPAIDCGRCEDLFTEFLDGYVAAPSYHSFEIHIQECDSCSTLLTDTVMAVASCHSVHSEESFDASELLIQRILAATCLAETKPAYKVSWRERAMAFLASTFHPISVGQWATAMVILLATSAALLMQFSDDRSLAGVYRKGNIVAGRAYSWTASFLGKNTAVIEDVKGDVKEGISTISNGIDSIKKEEQNPETQPEITQTPDSQPANVTPNDNHQSEDKKPENNKSGNKKNDRSQGKAKQQSLSIPAGTPAHRRPWMPLSQISSGAIG